MKRWRSGHRNTINARAINKGEWPKLVEAMKEDGVVAVILSTGIDRSVGGYSLTGKSVGEAWGLSKSQMRSLQNYVYSKGW